MCYSSANYRLNNMLSLNIATGVILVLLGMRYIRKGLDRLFGSQLVDWLQQMTNNRYKAFFGGMVAGAIAPSSSGMAMLSVQMLNQTALTAGRMLAVVLGENVGITVSAQLLAFRLQDYSGVFLLAGGIGFLFLNRALFRGAGHILLGIVLLTMMTAGWGSIEGRRLAIGSPLIKGCGALLILVGSSRFFVFILNLLPGEIDRQAANLNTFFNDAARCC
jgi:phosphate:Na+ symporter